jgi:hypothetical protein
VRNGFTVVSVLADAKGLKEDVVAGAPNGEEVGVDAKGFMAAGEGDLLGRSCCLSGGLANRTCLLL